MPEGEALRAVGCNRTPVTKPPSSMCVSDFFTEISACVVRAFRLLLATVTIFVESSNDAR